MGFGTGPKFCKSSAANILAVIISAYTSEIPYVYIFERRGVKKTPSGCMETSTDSQ